MILTGRDIHREVLAGRIQIDDYDSERLEPNSYGFRLARTIIVYDDAEIDVRCPPKSRTIAMDDEGLVLEPGRFYLGATMEAMGSRYYAATLYACRSVSTLGLWIQFSAPLGHSGAVFPWTLEISTACPVRVYPGMIIGKLAFWAMLGAAVHYDGRYTGSVSAVPSRLSLDPAVSDPGMQTEAAA
jgi:dCTP deaminase